MAKSLVPERQGLRRMISAEGASLVFIVRGAQDSQPELYSGERGAKRGMLAGLL